MGGLGIYLPSWPSILSSGVDVSRSLSVPIPVTISSMAEGMREDGANAQLVSEPPYRRCQPSKQQTRVAVALATFGRWVAGPVFIWARESAVQCVLAFSGK